MKFKGNFLFNYSQNAPLALAIERAIECEIMSQQTFSRPILDIGCGDGLFAFILFNEKIDLGIDPNLRELKQAKEYGMYQELIECQGSNVPKESGTFKTIFSNSVLEHIVSLKPMLKEAHRLLAPEGRFYVTLPTDKFDKYSVVYQVLSLFRLYRLAEKYRIFFNYFWKHFNFHNKEGWESIFRDCGFEVIDDKEYASKAICLFDDFLAPFAFISFITKRILNRWIVSSRLRRVYVYPFYAIARGIVKRYERGNNRGLRFFSLMKR